jgi:hypothetical protein
VCDHLVILSASRVVLEGDLAEVLRTHKRLTGPRRIDSCIVNVERVIEAKHAERQSTLLVRVAGPILDPTWQVQDVSLEGLVLAPLRSLLGAGRAAGGGALMIWLTWRQHRAETLVLGGILLVAIAGLVLVELAMSQPFDRLGLGTCTGSHCAARFSGQQPDCAGYRFLVAYQPADRFWRFQAIECGIYLVLSALLLVLTAYWVRRRVT